MVQVGPGIGDWKSCAPQEEAALVILYFLLPLQVEWPDGREVGTKALLVGNRMPSCEIPSVETVSSLECKKTQTNKKQKQNHNKRSTHSILVCADNSSV